MLFSFFAAQLYTCIVYTTKSIFGRVLSGSAKRGETSSSVVSFIRRFRFDLLDVYYILYNSAERLQEAIEHSSEDRDPRHGSKLLIENLLITPQVKLTSDEANCKSGCNSKDKWTNGIMEYSIFNCTVRGLCLYEQYK